MTHIAPLGADHPIGYSLSARLKLPRAKGSGPCGVKCKGGNACCCTAKYAHSWHICNKAECLCHQANGRTATP